jgi:hypothetical protein
MSREKHPENHRKYKGFSTLNATRKKTVVPKPFFSQPHPKTVLTGTRESIIIARLPTIEVSACGR